MSKRLTKQELIDEVKTQIADKRPDITKADVEALSDALWETIRNESSNGNVVPVSYTHLRAHETGRNLVCRLLLEKKII